MSFTGERPPERLNLARHCLSGKPPEKTALIVAGAKTERWTYGALEDAVLRLGEGFRSQGVERGERLFIRMGNSLDYALVFLAANAIGAVPIPASSMLTAIEIGKLLQHSGARFMAWDGELELPALDGITIFNPDKLARLKLGPPGAYAETAADDPAYLIYTSGTSGSPKGVLHAQRAIWGRRPMYQGWYGIGPDDVMLHTGAFNWTYTLGTGLFDPFVNGATSVVHIGERDPQVWERLVKDHGATLLASVPGIYRQLLRNGFKPGDTLRHGLTAGEALALPLRDGWNDATGLEIYEALGMSEISTYISSSPSVPVRRGSPGKAQAGRSIRILDDGQIGVHRTDPGLLLRYWGEEPIDGRLVRHRRHGRDRCGRLRLVQGPCRRPDERGRLPRLAARGRGRSPPASRRGRRRRARVAGVRNRFDHRGFRRPATSSKSQRRRATGVCQGQACRL